jgi:acetolactate synthase I/II/III large subunit
MDRFSGEPAMVHDFVERAQRPLLVIGHGVRLAGEQKRLQSLVARFPFVSTWTGADLVPTDHPMNLGIIGMSGQRGANKALYEADLILVLGSHLSLPQTTTLTAEFAPQARKLVVDIDPDQLANMTVEAEHLVCDLRDFFQDPPQANLTPEWEARCGELKALNRVNPRPTGKLNSYVFNDRMTRMLPEGVVMVVDGGGVALYTGFQSSHIKEGQRLICSSSMSAMGSGLPEAIGACFANDRKLTTCLIGDGSLMLNLQELQTIATHRLPIVVFVINNQGYLAIKHTQDGFLDGRRFGVGGNDLSFPDIQKLAYAFGISYIKLEREELIEETVGMALDKGEPVICEVMCDPDQKMLWKQGYRKEGDKFVPCNLSEMECG